jgi:aldehyde dehydrogenase (NAD+)
MLSFDPRLIAVPTGHFIDGALVADATGDLPVRRPCDGAVYTKLPLASADVVDRAVSSAKKAFRTSDWAKRPPRERARVMRRWADLVDANRQELARLEAVGSTRPIAQADGWDVPYLAETIRFFAEFADKYGGEVAATQSDRFGMVITEPRGVIAAIAPWNFPLVMAGWKLAPALAAGNAVVLKPSEMTPVSVLRLAELAIEAGLPSGIFNIVQGTGAGAGDALCRHPDVAKITFTGSTKTGAAIMATAALNGVKPVTLELGGKSPQIVFEDADIDLAASCIARSILGNAGQVCVAGSRLLVHRNLRDALLDRVAMLARDVKPGSTWYTGTSFSPIISAGQLDRVNSIVHRTVAEGAEALIGGHAIEGFGDGTFYAPTILIGVDQGMEAARAEIFGPVLTVQTFEDEEEALALADHPEFGLASGVYTRDLSRALRMVRSLEAGTVWINRYGRSDDFIMPTGGYKSSGIGKDLGREAYEANLRSKSVLIDI